MSQSKLHLISHVLCPYVQRSVIVLLEKNIPYSRSDIELGNKPDWFKQISPLGKVPVLSVNNEVSLFESGVICEYLDEITSGSLHPVDILKKSQHRSWIEFGSGILTNIAELYNAQDKESFELKSAEIKEKFWQLENELLQSQPYPGPYFSGDQFRLIDAVYGPIFRYFDTIEQAIDLRIFEHMPKVLSWRKALQQHPSVKNAVSMDYANLLLEFLIARKSYLSSLIKSKQGYS